MRKLCRGYVCLEQESVWEKKVSRMKLTAVMTCVLAKGAFVGAFTAPSAVRLTEAFRPKVLTAWSTPGAVPASFEGFLHHLEAHSLLVSRGSLSVREANLAFVVLPGQRRHDATLRFSGFHVHGASAADRNPFLEQ